MNSCYKSHGPPLIFSHHSSTHYENDPVENWWDMPTIPPWRRHRSHPTICIGRTVSNNIVRGSTGVGKFRSVMEIENALFQDLESYRKERIFKAAMVKFWFSEKILKIS